MKAELGVCYYPEHWREDIWLADAKRMKETGLAWVRIGEFAWSRLAPQEGQFDWAWLDRAVDVLGQAGLKVVMGTPSATPPQWVVQKYPDMLPRTREGHLRKFGSRRHYCFSHLGYRKEAARMASRMAERWGKNPYVMAWQIDNEYGCHDTVASYSDAARLGFISWLQQKYGDIASLNRAWGNVFWSMEYRDFKEIDLPNLTVTEANPSHVLDFKRFSSDQVVAFNRAQVDAVRPYTSKPLIHNYMGRVTGFDHFTLGADLEIASWDSYPLGFLERNIEASDDYKARFARQGDPDFQAFHHDLYRAVGRGRWWVMEQQPGPVNWAPYNPVPLDGMVKLWSMEAIAHGAEVVSYFRWRQAPFAQEQMHAGLLRCDRQNAQGQVEASELAKELDAIADIEHKSAQVAIVFDYVSQWAWEAEPHGQDFDYFALVFGQYRALRALGLSVDILPADCADFGSRKLVLIPGLMAWNDKLLSAIDRFKGVVLAGPRTGLKTKDMQIAVPLGPDFAGAKTSRVASFRPNIKLEINKGGRAIKWLEELELLDTAEAWRKLDDKSSTVVLGGASVITRKNNHYYLGAWLDHEGYLSVFKQLSAEAGLKVKVLPEGVRLRQMGKRQVLFNYNAFDVDVLGHKLKAAGFKVL